ncbi:MAG: O-antigen ligase family protein, partial [Elusimicrobia bacterium]|nr:O-antigen ligase family protein [Elusimicrobiota bacterium]
AGYLLIATALALGEKLWAFAAVFVFALIFTGSRGAVFAGALTLTMFLATRKNLRVRAIAALLFLLEVTAILKMSLPSLSDRGVWWSAAVKAILDRFWVGFGPGSFQYIYSALHAPTAGGLSSIFAHNYFLQFTSEMGIICALAWFAWIVLRLSRFEGAQVWAIIAVVFHSTIDFTLNVPSVFFIFCCLLSSGLKREDIIYVSGAKRWAVAAVALIAAVWLSAGVLGQWTLQKKTLALKNGIEEGKISEIARENFPPENFAVSLISAQHGFRKAVLNKDRAELVNSAVNYEKATRLNPFRPATYGEACKAYSLLGYKNLCR